MAVGFPPQVRLAIADRLVGLDVPKPPIPSENLHITLRFLGDLDRVAVDRLSGALDDADLPGAFGLRLGGLGAFPRARAASVLWIDVDDGAEELAELQACVDDGCEVAGLGREERPFVPHVTVLRARPAFDARSLVGSTPPLGIRSPVDEVVVLRSVLGGGPARYEPIERFPLSGA